MACELATIQANACTSGIGKITSRVKLLQLAAQSAADWAQVSNPSLEYNVAAIQERACSGGIGKLISCLRLLIAWLQNLCGDVSSSITFALLDSATTQGATVATASVTPSANALLLLAVARDGAINLNTILSVTGCGLDWELVRDDLCGDTGSLAVYRALGPFPTSGPVTVVFESARNEVCLSLVQFANVDNSGTNGSGAIVQVVSDSGAGANPSITLAPINPSGLNATIGFGGNNQDPFDGAVEAGWTEDVDTGMNDNEALGLYISHKLLSTDASWTVTRAASNWGGIALEIKAHP